MESASRTPENVPLNVINPALGISQASQLQPRQALSGNSLATTPSPNSAGQASSGSAALSATSTINVFSNSPSYNPAAAPVSVDDRLTNFQQFERSREQSNAAAVQRAQQRRTLRETAAREKQPTLERLRGRALKEESIENKQPGFTALIESLLRAFHLIDLPPLPTTQDHVSLVHHYYPPRGEVDIEVCDFGPGRAERHRMRLGDIQKCWEEKPSWASVRWIQAPLGVGILHSSVEDLFLNYNAPRGKLFNNAGSPGWPYLVAHILTLQDRQYFQDMRDVNLLSKRTPGLSSVLNQTTFTGDVNRDLQADVQYRCRHMGTECTFWNLAERDMPWQLTEGYGIGQIGPPSSVTPLKREIKPQMLATHPFYRSAQIVKQPCRCFHRGDGVLLTLMPSTGVNYIERDFSHHLKIPPETLFDCGDASALAHVWELFSRTGTDSWHTVSVEWFLVYLMTEIVATPHTISQGFNAPSLPIAYHLIVQNLKTRRFDPWRRHESIQLVQDYINCVDELNVIVEDLAINLKFLNRLRKDCEILDREAAAQVNNAGGKTMVDRVTWSIKVVAETHGMLDGILKDLKDSMQALFQLRSIEQNELAIAADSQNKAILIFTGVTIIFLPLSFFTSYFGMNLQGIINTNKTEKYFWAACGSFALTLVLITTVFAFRQKIVHAAWRKQKLERLADKTV